MPTVVSLGTCKGTWLVEKPGFNYLKIFYCHKRAVIFYEGTKSKRAEFRVVFVHVKWIFVVVWALLSIIIPFYYSAKDCECDFKIGVWTFDWNGKIRFLDCPVLVWKLNAKSCAFGIWTHNLETCYCAQLELFCSEGIIRWRQVNIG
jgi:hypothetical protein